MVLINKDCIEVMEEMDDNSIDLCLKCDMPYENTKAVKDYENEFSEIANELKRIIKK